MALHSIVERIDHPFYDCRVAKGVNGPVGFFVKLYLIFSQGSVYTLHSPEDWIDHCNLIRESGQDYTSFTYDLLVTSLNHSEMYDDIIRYVPKTNLH